LLFFQVAGTPHGILAKLANLFLHLLKIQRHPSPFFETQVEFGELFGNRGDQG
jgi:hypothetical protein